MGNILEFIDLSSKGYTTKFLGIENTETKERYGVIKWDGSLRMYVHSPFGKASYTSNMLDEISLFLKQLNKKS